MNIILIICILIFHITYSDVHGKMLPQVSTTSNVSDDADKDDLPLVKSGVTLPSVIIGNPTENSEEGQKNRPLRVIVYHSLNCPHCKLFKTEKLAALKEKYVDTNLVYFEFIDFPINWVSIQAAKLAWCKKGDLESHEKFERIITDNFKIDAIPVENDWVNKPQPKNQLVALLEKSIEMADIPKDDSGASLRSIAALIELLEKHGLTVRESINCLNDRELDDSIVKPAFEAQKTYKLDYAPGFLINNKMVSMEDIESKIEEALKESE